MNKKLLFTICLIFFIIFPLIAYSKNIITDKNQYDNFIDFKSLEKVSLSKAGTTFLAMDDDSLSSYEKGYLWFEDWAILNLRSGAISRFSRPMMGKYGKPLSWKTFYEKVGRDDLKRYYLIRRGIKIGLYVTGTALFVTGSIVMMTPFFKDEIDFQGDKSTAYYAAGGSLMGVGFVMYCVALFIRTHKLGMPEIKELADKYNKKLKRRGRLQKTKMASSGEAIDLKFSFQPISLKGGGGIKFTWQF